MGVDRRGMVDELTENGSSESQHRQRHVPEGSSAAQCAPAFVCPLSSQGNGNGNEERAGALLRLRDGIR